MTYGKWLKGELERLSLRQKGLAKDVGVSKEYISMIVHGRKPGKSLKCAIAMALRIEEDATTAGMCWRFFPEIIERLKRLEDQAKPRCCTCLTPPDQP